MNRENFGVNRDRNTEQNGSINAEQMLKKIQALAFAKVETELYLNGHPECKAALDYYKKLCNEYDELVSVYENTVMPITHEGAVGERWEWGNSPWPWQNEWEV